MKFPIFIFLAVLCGCSGAGGSGEGVATDLLAAFSDAELRSDRISLEFLVRDPHFENRGWATPERSMNRFRAWTTDRTSRLRLPVHSTGDKELRFRAHCHPSIGPELPLLLSLNGNLLDTVSLSPEEQEFRIVVPASVQARGSNELEISAPRRHEPLPEEPDQRHLVAAFSSLELVPLGSESGPAAPTMREKELVLPPGTSAAFYLRWTRGSRVVLKASGALVADVVLRFETDGGVRSTVTATKRGERIAIDSTPEELGEEPVRLELANEGEGNVRVGTWSVVRPKPAYTHARVEPEGASRLERPNVVIYLVDALRADYLSVYGWSAPTSPRLEAFAAESVVFTDAWAQASWTRPTTASIFTGLHPSTHHSANERQKLDASLETMAERLTNAGYVTGAFVGNHVIGGRFGLDQGFETWNEGDKELYGAPARVLGELALSWLDGRVERKEPFFLYVHTMEPHSPYEPDDEHVAPFRVEEYRGNRDTEALLRLGQLGELEPEGMRFLKTQYQGEIRQNDAAFGAFLDGLRDRGLLDRTLVIFTADHGEEFIEHGGTGHGKTLYQEVVRIPLIIRPPGSAAAAVRATGVVEQIDLLPTILGYLDIDWTDALPGRDLSSTLEDGEPSKMPEVVFSEERFGVVEKYSVRTGSMKLILNNDGAAPGSRFELYDLASDPRERTNLIESHPVTRSFLQRELDAFRERESTQGLSDADTELELTPDELDKLRALGYIQ